MYELNPSHWVGQAAKTIEIIEKPEYLLNYMFIIKQLSQNVHNLVQFKCFTIINPFPLTQ